MAPGCQADAAMEKIRLNSKMYKQSHCSREKTVLVFSYEMSGITCAALVIQESYSRKKGIKRRNERNVSFSWLTNYKWRGITVVISLRNSVPEKKGR